MATLVKEYEELAPIARLGIALVLMAACVWYFWDDMIVPKQEILQAKQEELNKIVNELKDSNTLLNPITMEEELNKANREYKKMIELLPDEPAIEKILNDFASLSRLSGVEIREFMPINQSQGNITGPGMISGTSQPTTYTAPPVGADPLGTGGQNEDTNSITISLKLQGTFSSMVSFMDMAMNLPRVIRIQDFEMLHDDRELKLVQRPKLSFTARFTAYYQKGGASKKTAVAETSDEAKSSNSGAAPKPIIDLNEVIDKSFSAKGSTGP